MRIKIQRLSKELPFLKQRVDPIHNIFLQFLQDQTNYLILCNFF